jgi:hypothetical protein
MSTTQQRKTRIDLEVVAPQELIKIQQKLNTWHTTKTLVKFETQPLADGRILFKIIRVQEG